MIALVMLGVNLKDVKSIKCIIINVALYEKHDIHMLYALLDTSV
jgi:hypothetical protein